MGCVHFKAAFFCNAGETSTLSFLPLIQNSDLLLMLREELIRSRAGFMFVFTAEVEGCFISVDGIEDCFICVDRIEDCL